MDNWSKIAQTKQYFIAIARHFVNIFKKFTLNIFCTL